ncbi:hypothetical protein C1Y63_05905 [Corynebacterium sp. 13CS0277]|uniref:hypothetical protein n=1 Tax=Corynebacterium sp. 13CS0277 TaxID=2071994 RepID=UPI000D042ED0|nr:hypothetical protein [Corynebacterium sp. 13CS0277]PRQ11534.1 hypothetical protein C1Y63_05905 [Corynebacterium sp. 13CS0277]
MSFQPGNATVFTGYERVRQAAHAFGKTARPLAVVAPGMSGAQLAAAVEACRRPGVLRAVVTTDSDVVRQCADLGVDVVFHLSPEELATGSTALVPLPGFEDAAASAARLLRVVGLTRATLLAVCESEYPALWQAQRAAHDFGGEVTVLRVPIVRRPDGVPVGSVAPGDTPGEDAIALSAALAGCALVAEDGPQACLDFAARVAPAATFRATDLQLGDAPAVGEGCIFGYLGAHRDVAFVPFGIGVRPDPSDNG